MFFRYKGRVVEASSKTSAIRKIAAAYFSKEAYERKKKFAQRTAGEGIRRIAEILEEEGLGSADDLEIKLEPIRRLSHARHDMHSSRDSDMDCMDEIGHQYSDGCLGLDAQEVNEELGLVPGVSCNVGYIPEVSIHDGTDMIADYYDVDASEVEDNWNDYVERIYDEWRSCKNDVSEKLRKWFRLLNERFGTNFPQ